VFVVVYFVIDSDQKLLDIPLYSHVHVFKYILETYTHTHTHKVIEILICILYIRVMQFFGVLKTQMKYNSITDVMKQRSTE